MEILKPCPFCGGRVSLEMLDSEQQRNIRIYHAIHCPECWFWMFKGLSKEKVIKRWNKRPGA